MLIGNALRISSPIDAGCRYDEKLSLALGQCKTLSGHCSAMSETCCMVAQQAQQQSL